MFKSGELARACGGRLRSGKEDLSIRSISTDSRSLKRHSAFVAIKGDHFDGHDFIPAALKKGAVCVIVGKKAKPAAVPAGTCVIEVPDTLRALGEIARYHRRRFTIPVIAVTGSNGKTSTKEMVAHLLSARYNVLKNEGTKNNQIGLPLALLGLNSGHDLAVLEIGSNHFGEVGYLAGICLPNIGIITNIGPSHLEHFRGLEGVFREKISLVRNLEGPRIAVLNADDRFLKAEINKTDNPVFVIGVALNQKADFCVSALKFGDRGINFTVNRKHRFELKSPARHNLYNALTAIAVARIFGIDYQSIGRKLSGFNFPQSRFNPVTLNNVKFIDDTYNSNPFSLSQALQSLGELKVKGRKILIMGDMLELGDQELDFHAQAGRDAARVCDALIAVGRLSEEAAAAARQSGLDSKRVFTCRSADQAREFLFGKLSPDGDDVILVKGSRRMKMEQVFR